MQTRILSLAEITDEAVGGKARGLAALQRMGLAVPPAFIIQYARVDEFPQSLVQHYEAIGAGLVAVRSSALGEDSADNSFAGQYETLLNVSGLEQLHRAINHCVLSLHSKRADAYTRQQTDLGDVHMCVVVQRMVNASAAGVLFSADPVSGRHDRLVIDAVEGFGEALVSGEATPDHYEVDAANRVVGRDLVGSRAILSDQQIQSLVVAARQAQRRLGYPLDMEWAFDQQGNLYWLQARPITTLGSDLNELDTAIPNDHVITRCNVGEMMPGAVCPLTFSVQGRAIEHGMQHMMVEYGGRPRINEEWTQINGFFGHMFINMTGGLESARYVSINTADTMAQSLCGRPVAELKEPDDLAPLWRRWWGSWQFARYCYRSQQVLTEFEKRFKHAHIPYSNDSRSMLAHIDNYFALLCETSEVHLRSSALSGVMEGVVQAMVSAGKRPPTSDEQAQAARLLAGAENVESAVMVARLDAIVDLLAEHPHLEKNFQQATVQQALQWLRSEASGAAGLEFAEFLAQHGHRTIRELCLREAGWSDAPDKLIVTMQASVAARLQGSYQSKRVEKVDLAELPRGLHFILPIAHNAVRRREHTKSMLVLATHRIKRAYRHLASLLVAEGHLPEADLVFFFTREELRDFVAGPSPDWFDKLKQRRVALSYQEKLEFDEIYLGKPEPVSFQSDEMVIDGQLLGRPVSRGVVEGIARVALTVHDAAALQPGEILIAPITDVGWTPYFSMIAGLATDVGSAVSHGAVIAREYGLPAIVNLRRATKNFKTGDRVRLDAERGILSLLE